MVSSRPTWAKKKARPAGGGTAFRYALALLSVRKEFSLPADKSLSESRCLCQSVEQKKPFTERTDLALFTFRTFR